MFLHPGWLWLMPIAALPPIIHLLSLRKPPVVELPTFSFLLGDRETQTRRLSMLDWILAALRSIFLGLLVLWLARPMPSSRWLGGRFGEACLLVIDASASMRQPVDGAAGAESAFDRARSAAKQWLATLPAGSTRVYRAAAELAELTTDDRRGQIDWNEAIDRLQPTSEAVDFRQILVELARRFESADTPPHVVVVTDCQAANWNEWKSNPPGDSSSVPRITLSDVGPERPVPFLSIQLAAAPHDALLGLPTPIEAMVRLSDAPFGKIEWALQIDGEEAGRAAATLDAQGVGRSRLWFVPRSAGNLECALAVAAERFAIEPISRFNLQVRRDLRVLSILGRPPADPQEEEGFFLKSALPDPAFRCREIQEWEIAPAALSEADVALLVNAGGLSEQHCRWIRDAVADGMGLIILPGSRVDADALGTRLLAPDGSDAGSAWPRLLPAVGEAERVESHDRIAWLDAGHPALSVFEGSRPPAFATARLYRHFPIAATTRQSASPSLSGTAKAGVRELMRDGAGRPILVEWEWGRGRVVLAGFGLSPRDGNLAARPDCMPLIAQLVRHAAAESLLTAPPWVACGRSAELALSPRVVVSQATATLPARGQVPLDFDRQGDRLAAFISTAEPGFAKVELEVRAIGARNIGVNPDRALQATESLFGLPTAARLDSGFAVGVDPRETDLGRLDLDALSRTFPPGQFNVERFNGAAAAQDAAAARTSNGLLWFATVVLCVEGALAIGILRGGWMALRRRFAAGSPPVD